MHKKVKMWFNADLMFQLCETGIDGTVVSIKPCSTGIDGVKVD